MFFNDGNNTVFDKQLYIFLNLNLFIKIKLTLN